MVALLRPAVGQDWADVNAGRLEWSCRQTAEHVASDLVAYAGQLAGRAQNRYVPFAITIDGREGGLDPADNEGILDVITTTGALLTAAVRTAPAPRAASTRSPSAARTVRASPRWASPKCCCTPTTWPRAWG